MRCPTCGRMEKDVALLAHCFPLSSIIATSVWLLSEGSRSTHLATLHKRVHWSTFMVPCFCFILHKCLFVVTLVLNCHPNWYRFGMDEPHSTLCFHNFSFSEEKSQNLCSPSVVGVKDSANINIIFNTQFYQLKQGKIVL